MFEKKEITITNLPNIPEDNERISYKITIERVTTREIAETTSIYVGDDGKTYKYSHNIPEGIEYKNVKVFTGDIDISRKERAIYEQELNDLDVGEMSVFINRAK